MKRNELYSYTHDFLSILYLKNEIIDKISAIVLFGSVARGNFDKQSDIDIFIDVNLPKDIPFIETAVNEAINEFEVKSRGSWHLRGIKNQIKCIVGMLSDDTWKELKKDIESYGILLYGRFKSGAQDLESYSLFDYSLRDFKQKKRVAFQRRLLGYKSKKKKKVYASSGLIGQLKGTKLENNNLIVPTRSANSLQKFFIENKVTPKIKEIWIRP